MKILNKIALLAASAAIAIGCVPEYIEVDQTKAPQASEIDARYNINEETNEVTFYITNEGMVPIWIVENEIVGGRKTTKNYTGNNVTLLFNERGEHTIHVKAYNAHGTSVAAKPVTFSLTGYVSYDKGLKGWDPDEDTNLWRNAVKTNMEYYYATGSSWTPAEGLACTEGTEGSYIVTLPVATVQQWQAQVKFKELGISTSASKTYDFQMVMNSNNAHPGVTVKLTSSTSDEVFYFADKHVLEAGKDYLYQKVSMAGLDLDDMTLVLDFGGCAENTEVEIKQIVFSEHQENHVLTDDSGKWNADIEANLWKGAKKDNFDYYFASTSDWIQGANATAKILENDIEVTMPGVVGTDTWQAQVKLMNLGIATSAGKKYDFQFVLKADGDHPGTTIKLTDQGDDGNFYCADKHKLVAGKEYLYQLADVDGLDMNDMMLVFDFAGAPANSVVTVSDIIICEHQADHVVKAEDPNANTIFDALAVENLWLGANKSNTELYYAHTNDWAQLPTPTLVVEGENSFSLSLPTASHQKWQAQVKFNGTGIATTEGKLYDFQAILNLSEDHPGVTFKLTNATDDVSYFEETQKVTGGKDFVFQKSNMEGLNISSLKVVFDFGGNADNTEVLIKDIIIQEHREK